MAPSTADARTDMAEGATEDNLSIRCPGCGQRFKVGPDLMGRMVECGTCEHRFRVNDDVIVRSKRFYPGDRKDAQLERFSRVPMASSLPSGFQPAQYSSEPPPRNLGPTSPLRLICGLLATIAILAVLGMLAFGGNAGGILDGADLTKRLMLAIFTAVISTVFLLIANPSARGKAVAGALAAAAGMISLAVILQPKAKPIDESAKNSDELTALIDQVTSNSPEKVADPYAELKAEMGYGTLEREILRDPGVPGKAPAGIWLKNLKEYHKAQVGNYLIRSTNADLSSHMYPQPTGYLLVLSGVTDDLSQLAKACERFGEVKHIFNDMRVIEVGINNDTFTEGSMDKLTDPKSPSFYELNRRELESIDLERCRKAIVRLGSVAPISYRPDIVKRMKQLLNEGDTDMQAKIATALETWSEEGDGSLEAIHAAAERIREAKISMPETIMTFLSKRNDLAAIPILDALWLSDTTTWESIYMNFGAAAEPTIVKHLQEEATSSLKMSALRILAKIGTAKSIPTLETARQNSAGEMKVLIDQAIEAIRNRK